MKDAIKILKNKLKEAKEDRYYNDYAEGLYDGIKQCIELLESHKSKERYQLQKQNGEIVKTSDDKEMLLDYGKQLDGIFRIYDVEESKLYKCQ